MRNEVHCSKRKRSTFCQYFLCFTLDRGKVWNKALEKSGLRKSKRRRKKELERVSVCERERERDVRSGCQLKIQIGRPIES